VSASGQQRRTMYYTGRVQGVGFRYTARSLAQSFAVTGMVRNLDDGRVLLVAEGTADELDRFLTQVYEQMNRHIRKVDVSTSAATGEFDDFGIETGY
jgi:acylphosphatase